VSSLARRAYGLLVVIFAIDQITKSWAVSALQNPERNIDLIGSLRLNLVFNEGMSFSKGEGLGRWLGMFAMLVLIGLVVYLYSQTEPAIAYPLALVGAGVAGNGADRALRGDGFLDGAVIDFVDLQWWPVWNVADAAIVLGGLALVVFGSRVMEAATEPADAPMDGEVADVR
jgi:signal peptidase II